MKKVYRQLSDGNTIWDSEYINETEGYMFCKQIAKEHWATNHTIATNVNGRGAWHVDKKRSHTDFQLELTYDK